MAWFAKDSQKLSWPCIGPLNHTWFRFESMRETRSLQARVPLYTPGSWNDLKRNLLSKSVSQFIFFFRIVSYFNNKFVLKPNMILNCFLSKYGNQCPVDCRIGHQDNLPWNHLSFPSLQMKFCNTQYKIDFSFISSSSSIHSTVVKNDEKC